jgi:uncharacterized membrane protein YoaK (UPF0700 family)
VEASPERPDAARRVQPLLLALSLLTLVTGLVDAACYLGLGQVFTANMTGNVVLLAFGAAGAQGLPVLAPSVSLAVFLVGATAGGRLASSMVGPAGAQVAAPVRRRWLTVTLLLELLPVAVAGVLALGPPVGGGGARRYVMIALLAAAMGLQNATVHRLAVPDITTTVLIQTLTGLAADSWLAGGHSPRAGRRVAAVGLVATGALVGALPRGGAWARRRRHRDATRARNGHRSPPTAGSSRIWSDTQQRPRPSFIQGRGLLVRVVGGSPERIRTAVTALRGRRPRPLDDGAVAPAA